MNFIVMEFVAGKTLEQLIGRRALKVNDVLKYGADIAAALAAAHAAGIVHRDLKLGNVMVTDRGVVKVLDFGLAKLVDSAPTDLALTATLSPRTEECTIVGTVAYMSPEQAEGKPVDLRRDIFSFGAVLCEMITGRRRFKRPRGRLRSPRFCSRNRRRSARFVWTSLRNWKGWSPAACARTRTAVRRAWRTWHWRSRS